VGEMIVRVSVVDAERAVALMQRIRSEVDVEEVNFEQDRQQVRIDVEKNRDETLVEVLNLLESWLGADGLPPTNVEIDDHRYLLGAAS
jgi:type II secretory pathway component PulL